MPAIQSEEDPWAGRQEIRVQVHAQGGDGHPYLPRCSHQGLASESPGSSGNQEVDLGEFGFLGLEKFGENPYGEEGQ